MASENHKFGFYEDVSKKQQHVCNIITRILHYPVIVKAAELMKKLSVQSAVSNHVGKLGGRKKWHHKVLQKDIQQIYITTYFRGV